MKRIFKRIFSVFSLLNWIYIHAGWDTSSRPTPRFNPPFLLITALIGVNTGSVSQAQPLTLHAEKVEHGVQVTIENTVFTVYKTDPVQKYPYFYPVNGPQSAKSITTESSEPYPHHHSLFFGCDRVNGGNYWQEGNERGQILSQSLQITQPHGTTVAFQDECLWVREGASSPFRDERLIQISAPSASLRFIDFSIQLTALEEVRIDQSNHALFSARVVPELSVQQGGTLVNAQGHSGEKETFGKKSPWSDYWGTWKDSGIREGIAILTHPTNRWHPSPWFTRDYGFFSPTPMQWLENGFVRFEKGETLNLKYRVVIHSGDTQTSKIPELYAEWIHTASK